MTAPIETTAAAAEAQPEAVLAGVGKGQIEGRSLGQIAWTRFKKDRVAVAGGIFVLLLIVLAALSRPIQALFGLDPNAFNQDLIDPNTSLPIGGMGGMSWDHPLGVEPKFGRDILARILEGSWVSMVVAFGATLLSNVIGVVLGLVAGYYGGRVDAVVSRLMDTFLAFPLLLFAIAISATLQGGAFGLEGLPLHISVLIFVIGFFNWPYMGRIVRGQTMALREREFIDASRGMGPAAVRPVQGAAAEPRRADHRLLDPAHPDQHHLRGVAQLPRRRDPAPAGLLGRNAQPGGRLLRGRPAVHDRSWPRDLHYGAGLQPPR